MTNFNLSTADYKQMFLQITSGYANPERTLKELQNYYQLNRTQVVELDEIAGDLSNWDFTSPGEYDVDTDSSGFIYGELIDGGAGTGHTVNLYADSARTDLVATGTGDDSSTATLTTQTGHFLGGTVDIGVVTSAGTDDFRLKLIEDQSNVGLRLFNENNKAKNAFSALQAQSGDTISDIQAARNSLISRLTEFFDLRVREKVEIPSSVLVSNEVIEDGDGNMSLIQTGMLADLDNAMKNNAVPQTIAEITHSEPAIVNGANNTGVGTFTSKALFEWARSGAVSFVCTDETIGSEEFQVTFVDDEDQSQFTSPRVLTVGRTFVDEFIGMSFKLERTIAETGDGSAQIDASTIVVTGEDEDNTDDGVIHISITALGGGAAKIECFSKSTRPNSALVAEGSVPAGSGTFTVTCTARNNSGLTVSFLFDRDVAVTDVDIEFDLQVFKAAAPAKAADRFDTKIIRTATGLIQDFISDFKIALNSDTAGAETIPDGYAKVGRCEVLFD